MHSQNRMVKPKETGDFVVVLKSSITSQLGRESSLKCLAVAFFSYDQVIYNTDMISTWAEYIEINTMWYIDTQENVNTGLMHFYFYSSRSTKSYLHQVVPKLRQLILIHVS